jgi:hypothetical protein
MYPTAFPGYEIRQIEQSRAEVKAEFGREVVQQGRNTDLIFALYHSDLILAQTPSKKYYDLSMERSIIQ